jgi:hypothetical protein
MLFQTDEIDSVIEAIKDGQEQRFKSIMQMLLKMYTSSNGVYSMRAKAGQEHRTIDQPSLCIFGTAIPKHYYEAFSMKMLSNGFFARMLIVEAGKRSRGQFPPQKKLPEPITETAVWWRDFRPGGGNMDNWHPKPETILYTADATEALTSFLRKAESEYAAAEKQDDVASMTIWSRAVQKAQQLALIYACSENHEAPQITEQAIEWAWQFIRHLTQRMLFMVDAHLAESEFERNCKRFLEKLRKAPNGRLDHSTLLKRMKMSAREFRDLVETLRQRGDIEVTETPQSGHGGRPTITYRLAEGAP